MKTISIRNDGQYDIGVQIFADFDVTLVTETRMEQYFRATKPFGANSEIISVWEFVSQLLDSPISRTGGRLEAARSRGEHRRRRSDPLEA